MVIKSEALYNMCHFEHALVLFHRGQVTMLSHCFQKIFEASYSFWCINFRLSIPKSRNLDLASR